MSLIDRELGPGTRRVPGDLLAVVALVGLAWPLALSSHPLLAPPRYVVGGALVTFLPGYVLVAALFPRERGDDAGEVTGTGRFARPATVRGVNPLERVVLSFVGSVSVVVVGGLAVAYSEWGFRPVPVLAFLSLVTLAGCVVAARRRLAVPPEQRFGVGVRSVLAVLAGDRDPPSTSAAAAVNVLLVLGVLLLAGAAAYRGAGLQDPAADANIYLLTENESGALVADGYPDELDPAACTPLWVGVENQGRDAANYTVVVQLQQVAVSDRSARVTGATELDRFRLRVRGDGRRLVRDALAPGVSGERLRLSYRLYRGSAPADPADAAPYREVHIWVDVPPAEARADCRDGDTRSP